MWRQYQQADEQYNHRLKQLKLRKQQKSTCELMSKAMLQRPLTVDDMGGQGKEEPLDQGRRKRTKHDDFEEDEKMSTASATVPPTPSGIATSFGHPVADIILSMQRKLSLNATTDKPQ
ncbi:hypothetical protein BGZ47_011367 [Haplosporangium gracile]|nr:hypothetical protein BGZ47_011367 [Haplosporangium gracile]